MHIIRLSPLFVIFFSFILVIPNSVFGRDNSSNVSPVATVNNSLVLLPPASHNLTNKTISSLARLDNSRLH